MEDKILRPVYARIEYRSVQAEVEKMLAEGHSVKMIYDFLVKEGSLTMAYATFCDYVRGGGTRLHGTKKNEARKRDGGELLSEILESIEVRTENGCNLKLVYQKLVGCGLVSISFSDFFDFFSKAGGYQGSEIPDAYVFFSEDGLIPFYYGLESFLKKESDKTASQILQ